MSLTTGLSNLLAYSLQVAVLVGVGALLAALFRVRVPKVMLAYWQALLVTALLLPVVQPWKAPGTKGSGGAGFVVTTSQGSVKEEGTLAPALALALAAAAVGRGLWLLLGLLRLRYYRQRATMLVDLPPALREAEARVGATARFYLSTQISGPVTFGHRRARVLLPAEIAAMPEERLLAIGCHELLHVRRRDWAFTVAEECARAALFFHPVVAWLVSRIRLAREQCVDLEVVAITGARQAYLQTLLELARAGRRHALVAPFFLSRCSLKDRVDLLLREVAMSKTRVTAFVGAGALGLVLAVSAAISAFPLQALSDDEPPAAGDVVGGVEGGAAGGVEGGVAGGVEGGVAGGVGGGVAGGVSGGVEGKQAKKPAKVPKPVHKVNPVYPAEAKKDGIQGVVQLEVRIEKTGEVSKVKAVSGHKSLQDAAVEAVRQWRYEASDVGPMVATVTIEFRLREEVGP